MNPRTPQLNWFELLFAEAINDSLHIDCHDFILHVFQLFIELQSLLKEPWLQLQHINPLPFKVI